MRACMRPPEALQENAQQLFLQVSKVIPTRMHANSDTHTQTHTCLTE